MFPAPQCAPSRTPWMKSSRAKKRGNNQGSVYRRTDGGWCAAIVTAPQHTARRQHRQRRYFYARTKVEAERILLIARALLACGLPLPARAPSATDLSPLIRKCPMCKRRFTDFRRPHAPRTYCGKLCHRMATRLALRADWGVVSAGSKPTATSTASAGIPDNA
jgi:hypothetical protein